MESSTQTLQPNRVKRIVHATINSVLEEPLAIRISPIIHRSQLDGKWSLVMTSAEILNYYAGDYLHEDEGMTVEDDLTELQAAIAACGILDEGAATHGGKAALEKRPNETRRQRGRPKKKRVRRQDNRRCFTSSPLTRR